MGQNYRKLVDGLNLVPKPSDASTSLGDIEVLSSTNKLYFHNGTINSEILTGASSSVISNKQLDDSSVFFVDTSDATKVIKFDASGTTGTSTTLLSSQTVNRILTLPNFTDTIAVLSGAQTFTNKIIDAASNTISNLTNANLSGTAGITGANIATNTISNSNLAQMPAHTFKGNNTGSTANASDLTQAQLTAELNLFTNTLQGLVPASGGGTVNFLRADGTFATPPNSGGTVVSIGAIDSQSKSANGLVISGSSLYAQTADASFPGMVSIAAQSFAGLKSFTNNIASNSISDISGGLTITSTSGQNVTLQPNATGRLRSSANNGIDMLQIPSPTPPAAGYDSLYFKSNDQLYSMNSAGQERPVGSGGGSGGINYVTLDSSFQPINSDNFNFEASLGNWITYNNGGAAGTIAQSLAAFNTSFGVTNTLTRIGQKFTALISGTTDTVTFQLNNPGAAMSGNIVVNIYSDSAGLPGTLLATSDNYNASTIGAPVANVTFTFTTPASLGSGLVYHAVTNYSGVTFTGNFNIVSNNTNPYAGGNAVTSSDGGSTWSAVSGTDLTFDVQSTGTGGILTLTGGSSSLVMSRTTTVGEVLDGSASLKVVKSAVDSQNQGISVVANIPLGYRNQMGSFSFPFKLISGSLVQGDLQVAVYDVTNSTLIAVVNPDILANGIIKGTFYIPATTAQIRFGINFASASASAVTYSIDDVMISTNEFVFGATMTDSQKYTPSLIGFGTCTNVDFNYAQVGSLYYIQGFFTAGSPTAVQGRIGLPNGATIKSGQVLGILGQGGIGTGTTNDISILGQGGDDHLKYGAYNIAAFGPVNEPLNGNYLVPATCNVSFFAIVPIEGATTNLITQNTGTFSIANILANGTRVVGTPPTKLGEYRSYLRIASSNSYTETNGAPAIPPTANDGIVIYTGAGYVTGDAANQPTHYEIFIGKNIHYDIGFFYNSGRTGLVDAQAGFWVANLAGNVRDKGWSEQYDPTTGIFNLVRPLTYGTTVEDAHGVMIEDGTFTTGAGIPIYFDIYVSQNPIPVQFNIEPVYLKEVRPNGVDPGGFLAGIWQTRNLNTIENQQPWISLSSQQFTLDAGTYRIKGQYPAYYVNSHQGKIYNITDSVDVIVGSSAYSAATGGGVDNYTFLTGTFTITKQTVFEAQHRCQTTRSTYGVGVPDQISAFGVVGVFAQLEIEKLR